jgi:hypothetical protein
MSKHAFKRGTPFWERGVRRQVVPHLGPCYEWVGAHHPNGYGEFREHGQLIRAHVRAYELTYGPVPSGLWVLHRCDNPACFEPAHLYAGTVKDNARDAARAGHLSRGSGEDAVLAKFSDALIAHARQLRAHGWLLREIAVATGISESHLSRICRQKVR